MSDRPITIEAAASGEGRDITRGFLDGLRIAPVEDRVLIERGGGDYRLYDDVLRDDTVRAAVNQRIHGVIARPWEVRPGGGRAIDRAAADLLREDLDRIEFDRITAEMLSGVFYGFSVAEAIWEIAGRRVRLADLRVRQRRRFAFDGAGRLRLRTLENAYPGELMPERKFWVARFGADHHDAPYGLGLAHYLYWPVWLKRNAVKFWAVFLEKFGTPTAIGKYPPQTTEEEKTKLLSVLEAVQCDAAVVIPEGMTAELIEAKRSGTADHAAFVAAMDRAVLKVCLGQTATVEGTSGALGGEGERERVKDAILKADSDILSAGFNRTIAAWLTEWNFPGAAPPQVWRVFTDEDLDLRAKRERTIFDMGYRPTLRSVSETYGGEWEAVPKPGEPGGNLTQSEHGAAAGFSEQAPGGPDPTPVTAQAETLEKEAAPAWDEILQAVFRIVSEAESLPGLRDRILSAYGDLPSGRLSEIMAMAFAAADLAGRFDATEEASGG